MRSTVLFSLCFLVYVGSLAPVSAKKTHASEQEKRFLGLKTIGNFIKATGDYLNGGKKNIQNAIKVSGDLINGGKKNVQTAIKVSGDLINGGKKNVQTAIKVSGDLINGGKKNVQNAISFTQNVLSSPGPALQEALNVTRQFLMEVVVKNTVNLSKGAYKFAVPRLQKTFEDAKSKFVEMELMDNLKDAIHFEEMVAKLAVLLEKGHVDTGCHVMCHASFDVTFELAGEFLAFVACDPICDATVSFLEDQTENILEEVDAANNATVGVTDGDAEGSS